MNKKIWLLVLFIALFSNCYASWISPTVNMQTDTVSAAIQRIQDSLLAVDGTSQNPPAKLVTKQLLLNGATSGTTTITPNAIAGTTSVTLPAANSVTLPSGAVFFMLTGSCPSGTTDVTATYSNKFIMANATQGTTGDGSGTTEGHQLTSAETPSHTHNITLYLGSTGNTNHVVGADSGAGTSGGTGVTESSGSDGSHSHNITASNYKPAFVTCIMCEVQ